MKTSRNRNYRKYINEAMEPGDDADFKQAEKLGDIFINDIMNSIRKLKGDNDRLDIDFRVPSHAYNRNNPRTSGEFRVMMIEDELFAGFLNRRKRYELKPTTLPKIKATIEAVLSDFEQFAEEESQNEGDFVSVALRDIINNVEIGRIERGLGGYDNEFESYHQRYTSRRNHLNEGALKVTQSNYEGGPNEPFPDGSAKGDMFGSNKAFSINVTYSGDWDIRGEYSVIVENNDDDEAMAEKYFKTGKEAIKFAEKLIKETDDPLYDLKKMAKKYGMSYQLY